VTRTGEPPLAGARLLASVAVFALIGAMLGIVSAFLVPTGHRFGVHNGVLPATSAGTGGLMAAGPPATTASNGTLLSLGVILAFAGCLGLGLLARHTAGERIVALAPVSAWLIIALLALTEVRGDLVLPTIEPGIEFLYAGVIGGALSLLPRNLLTLLRTRATS
jgi:hypothetical protein